jgi:hypothetical protein
MIVIQTSLGTSGRRMQWAIGYSCSSLTQGPMTIGYTFSSMVRRLSWSVLGTRVNTGHNDGWQATQAHSQY